MSEDWRPIESAPYARRFIAENPFNGGKECVVVRYLHGRTMGKQHAVGEVNGQHWFEPTRWRPLNPSKKD